MTDDLPEGGGWLNPLVRKAQREAQSIRVDEKELREMIKLADNASMVCDIDSVDAFSRLQSFLERQLDALTR